MSPGVYKGEGEQALVCAGVRESELWWVLVMCRGDGKRALACAGSRWGVHRDEEEWALACAGSRLGMLCMMRETSSGWVCERVKEKGVRWVLALTHWKTASTLPRASSMVVTYA